MLAAHQLPLPIAQEGSLTAEAAAYQRGRSHGEVFTRRWVATTLLDLTGYTTDRDLGALSLLEPSCGTGSFLAPAVERLTESARRHGRAFIALRDAVRAYDLQPGHVSACRSLCHNLLVAAGVPAATAIALARTWVQQADFLLPEGGSPPSFDGLPPESNDRPVDVVIGNPPYIRYDDLPAFVAGLYRNTWTTMRGRGDVYIGFIERSLRMLRCGGKVGFICADRWMRNQYGARLRMLVAQQYAVDHVWTMHDVDAFETHVSAYPAIMVLGNHSQASAIVADTTAEFGAGGAAALVKAAQDEALTDFADLGVTAHRLPHWFSGHELWPTGSPARLALIEYLNDRFRPLHDPKTDTKVSIGVATGADSVYITKDPTVAESDRMLPLATSRDLTSGTFDWHGTYLVNPWAEDGGLVSLDDYPKMAAYLSSAPDIHERFVARKNPTHWHRTIDKVQSSLIRKPKLLLQDMKSTIHPVLEHGGHYPHHNLYYVISGTWDMEMLGGILLSRIAQAFVEAYSVRMRGGTLRFQAQYLKRVRVPEAEKIDADIQEDLRVAFRTRDTEAATHAAALAYGIDPKEFDLA